MFDINCKFYASLPFNFWGSRLRNTFSMSQEKNTNESHFQNVFFAILEISGKIHWDCHNLHTLINSQTEFRNHWNLRKMLSIILSFTEYRLAPTACLSIALESSLSSCERRWARARVQAQQPHERFSAPLRCCILDIAAAAARGKWCCCSTVGITF